MLGFAPERVLKASPGDIWPVAADPARFPEWFDGVERAEAEREPGRGQIHLVAGRWRGQLFEIERFVEHWEPSASSAGETPPNGWTARARRTCGTRAVG
jgi:hypothetical protein